MNKRIQLYPASIPGQSGWMVQSDFDGTISLLDVTDTLLNRFGKPGWQELGKVCVNRAPMCISRS